MEVYLDNGATTRPRDEVIEEINYMFKSAYGNPSSLHRMGLEAERKVNQSRKTIAEFLSVKGEEIYFTSSGTESNNIAIQGIINKYSRKGKHIITSKIEHSSVLNIFKHYEEKGYKVTYLNVDEKGIIDLRELESSITEETILVSIMFVNNEIGCIQPVKEIKEIINSKNKQIVFHIDGVQAFGKIDFDVVSLGIDCLSFSGHKIHGPKGIAGLYVRKGLNIEPIIFGGKQERGLRSGTENVPGIVGLGKATEILKKNFRTEKEYLLKLKEYFLSKLQEGISNIKVNSFVCEKGAPHILNVSFIGVRGEVLLHYLENKGIYVSTGSACSSNNKGRSHVLKEIGLSEKEIDGTVRFSFAFSNTYEELDYVFENLKASVEEIRKITMR